MKAKKYIFISGVAVAMTLYGCSKSENAEGNEIAEDEVSQIEMSQQAEPAQEVAPAIPAWMPDSVTITATGLGIVIDNIGDTTVHPQTNTPITLNYRGRLTDGRVFDSSYDRGVPATFSAAQVIPGFGEGILMLGKGGKATLYIPSQLGYGPRGAGGLIGPNENLIFDIEIIDYPAQ